MKNIGKPCAGEPHARFDEEGQVTPAPYSTRFRLLLVAADSTQLLALQLVQTFSSIGMVLSN
ncbi:MAG: hypothetical protein OQK93_05485, partial [Gammaproteobacteria bacterium]|nr:hypothetical protein [Gammaproteobacteria bacterium]